ncbi:MAG: F0F1 ATP synthase subunit B [Dehalococcoidales bacterium]|nr:F0F1 ATP synthase subunit B [Dehalococcoidales bacterium]
MEGLGINLSSLLAQLVNFGLLLALLYIFAYKPVIKMLDQRSAKIKESIDQTEQIKEQAELAEKETARLIAEASKEGQKIIDQATQIGEETKQKAKQDAKIEAERLIAKAKLEIERERDDAIGELRNAFADLTVIAAGKVIDRSLDKEQHRQLIDKVLEESKVLNKN